MNDLEFENLIGAERDRCLPSCPANLEANVLRRVRLAACPAESLSTFGWIFGLLSRKTAGFGFAAGVVVLSVVVSVVATSSSLRAAETRDLAVKSLDFGVFEQRAILNLEH